MLDHHIQHLRCVDCGGEVDLFDETLEDAVVISGRLRCHNCRRTYPIIDTVAICFRSNIVMNYLSPQEMSFINRMGWQDCLVATEGNTEESQRAQKKVAENWTYQWEELADDWGAGDFSGAGLLSSEAFWNFVRINPQQVSGKRVVITCGGLGREAFHIAKANAETVFLNEIGTEIYKVRKLVPDADRKLVLLRSDACNLPLREGAAEVSICDHALQHIPNHRVAFEELVKVTKCGGRVAICVYSWENNFVMTRLVEPSKVFIHLLSLKAQRMLALPLTIIVFALAQGLYSPLGRMWPALGKKIFLFDHMTFWSKFPFSVLWISIFDLIHAPVSYHFSKSEIENLSSDSELTIEQIINTNGTLWSLVALKPKLNE